MKKLINRIIFTIIGISIFGISIYNILLCDQEKNFEKYGSNFNQKRTEIGLKKINENWEIRKFTWEDYWKELGYENYNYGAISKIIKIFSLENITTGMSYENISIDKNITYSKIIFLNSNILFWKNEIESEIDDYEIKIDSMTTENLSIRYYFKDDNGNKNYFEANHSVYKMDEFSCGTTSRMKREEQRISGKPYFGNITKKQADSLLIKWNIKN